MHGPAPAAYGDVLLATASSWGRIGEAVAARAHHRASSQHIHAESDSGPAAHLDPQSLFHGDVLLGMAFPQPSATAAIVAENQIMTNRRRRGAAPASQKQHSSLSRRRDTGTSTKRRSNNDVASSFLPFGDVLLATSSSWQHAGGSVPQRQNQPFITEYGADCSYGDLLLGASTWTNTRGGDTVPPPPPPPSSPSLWRLPKRGGGGDRMGGPPRPKSSMSVLPLPLLSVWLRKVSGVGDAIGGAFQGIVQSNATLLQAIRDNLLKAGKVYAGFALVAMVAGGTVGLYRSLVQRPRFVQYLEWDAQELVPEALLEYRRGIQGEGEDGGLLAPPPPSSHRPSWIHRLGVPTDGSKARHMEALYQKVNEAKAKQVEALCRKHCPEQWRDFQTDLLGASSSKSARNSSSSQLQDHPAWLRRLTKELYETKFAALMRPDYLFGLGRDGIDVTTMVAATGRKKNGAVDDGANMMMDPQLIEAVIADVVERAPTAYPAIWDAYRARLLPGQGWADRHDLVLRMVRDIQVQKKRQRQSQHQHQEEEQQQHQGTESVLATSTAGTTTTTATETALSTETLPGTSEGEDDFVDDDEDLLNDGDEMEDIGQNSGAGEGRV
jgi:hypothetical protein